MADYTDPGLAVKKLAANVKAKMASKIDGPPSGETGQLVYNATTNTWEPAPAGGGTASTDYPAVF